MTIAENIARIRANIAAAAETAGRDPKEIVLVGASKMNDAAACREAIAAGIDALGENRVQEMTAHLEERAYEGAKLHFIGHLQTNKVKQVVGKADLIESVDSERLLRAIDDQAARLGIVQDILLEVNVAGEESKGGISPEELPALAALAAQLKHVCLCGLMAIPPISHEPGANIPYFSTMRQLFVDIKGKMTDNQNRFMCLSMGMSGDFEDAIAQGATLVRVGTALFGPRPPMRANG